MELIGHGIDPERNKNLKKSINDIYNTFIEYYNAIVVYGRDMGAKHEENAKNESINKCVARAINLFRGITICCTTENGTNSIVLLRNLYEIKVYIQYIRYSDNSIAQRFFDYGAIAWYRYFERQKGKLNNSNLISDDQFDALKAKEQKFFEKYKGRKDTWSGKTIPEMIAKLPHAERAEEEQDYSTIYRYSSFFVHSNIISLSKIMSSQDMYKVDGDIDNIEFTYPMSIKAIMKILNIWLFVMDLSVPASISRLEEEIYTKMLSHFS